MRFFYLRDENNHPVGCLASNLNKSTDTIEYAVSVCNPLDQFHKKQAKELAAGRIAMGDCDSIAVSPIKGCTKKYIMELILEGSYPQRARDAAKRWLEDHEFTYPLTTGDKP
jgi:hypothetical protein